MNLGIEQCKERPVIATVEGNPTSILMLAIKPAFQRFLPLIEVI